MKDYVGVRWIEEHQKWNASIRCDGVTYPSDEEARFIYGVKNYTDGPCKNYDKNKDSEEDGLVFTQ